MDYDEISERARGVTLCLSFFFGTFGAHRFYVGKNATGILMLLSFGGMGIWWAVDNILVASGSFRDAEGRRVYQWAEPPPGPQRMRRGQVDEAVLAEIDHLRVEMSELAERVDFMERVFTQEKQRGAIPPAS